jgi:hypothetical protein
VDKLFIGLPQGFAPRLQVCHAVRIGANNDIWRLQGVQHCLGTIDRAEERLAQNLSVV